jgi:hypothetical protein
MFASGHCTTLQTEVSGKGGDQQTLDVRGERFFTSGLDYSFLVPLDEAGAAERRRQQRGTHLQGKCVIFP